MAYDTFLSLDLEMAQPSRKIIQVGVSVGSLDAGVLETHAWFIDPQEPITPFIQELTGITDAEIQAKAKPVVQVASELSALIQRYPKMFVNPVTWGGGDGPELLELFKEAGAEFPHLGRRWMDVKTLWTLQRLAAGKSTSGGLSSAMGSCKLPFKGRAHRADVDAENTLRFFLHILQREKTLRQGLALLATV